jgi:hypothetical protein
MPGTHAVISCGARPGIGDDGRGASGPLQAGMNFASPDTAV